MACYSPIKGYRTRGGTVTFKRPTNDWALLAEVPCGRCIGCRLEHSRQWAIRCLHEAKLHEKNAFITLTYDNQHLPEDGSLNLKHWQNFAKKVRNEVGKFRYFHCGEYGDETQRPHYHACLFGINFADDRQLLKTVRGNKLYHSPTLERMWPHGYSLIGEVTFESAAYVARYIMKKVTGEPADEHYKGRKKEYITMSRRPGIGHAWLNKFSHDVYPDDFVIIRGKKMRPPKYYDRALDLNDPTMLEQIKINRRQRARHHAKDNTYERLADKEFTAIKNLALYNRGN